MWIERYSERDSGQVYINILCVASGEVAVGAPPSVRGTPRRAAVPG